MFCQIVNQHKDIKSSLIRYKNLYNTKIHGLLYFFHIQNNTVDSSYKKTEHIKTKKKLQ